ncbi:unnamed protein product [Caenorhabditis bovis]|uniref:Uncharacterized protein n=1 Tax=Caenorhabditis bovis TaxID=2654633 RepID=A0A8S1ET13_9PELO|nr:unnamed protein product [Caenorhabditis bovis]
MNSLFVAAIVVAFTVAISAYQEPDLDALAEFCSKQSNKKYCEQIAQLAIDSVREAPRQQMQMEKRKPSFVRFGKRSSFVGDIDDVVEAPLIEKRKPSFVRFGRK